MIKARVAIGVLGAWFGMACGHGPWVTEVAGPDNQGALLIQCEGETSRCYSRAWAVCPGGYQLLSSDSRIDSSVSYTPRIGRSPPFPVTSETARTELLVRCKETDTARSQTPPDGALGYRFGESASDARAECEEQGNDWSESASGALCDGTAKAVDLPGRVGITFCVGKLCRLELVGRIATQMDVPWRSELERLEKKLSEKYGSPSQARKTVPGDCVGDGLLECLASGRASYVYQWQWKDGFLVWLMLTADAQTPALRVTYDARAIRAATRVVSF
jgi:hypothetical protein